jgi:hypothetical protein
VISSYLDATIIYGALLLNLWEETGWQGMVQRGRSGQGPRRLEGQSLAAPLRCGMDYGRHPVR